MVKQMPCYALTQRSLSVINCFVTVETPEIETLFSLLFFVTCLFNNTILELLHFTSSSHTGML